MRVLYVLDNPSWLRHEFEVLEELAGRGHEVVVGFLTQRDANGQLEQLLRRASEPRVETVPERGAFARVATLARHLNDLSLYGEPELRQARARRARWERKAGPHGVRRLAISTGSSLARTAPARPTAWVLRGLERLIPPCTAHVDLFRALAPSIVVVNGLVQPASGQADVVKAARALGVPSVYAVASWDNLSTKGRIKEAPTAVFVWNHALAEEAVRLHRFPRGRVAVIGAPRFDPWFQNASTNGTNEPVSAREGPFVLYLGSSRSIAPDEVGFVRTVAKLLQGDPRTSSLEVVVLPHPRNQVQWSDVRVPGLTIVHRDGFPVGQTETTQLRSLLLGAEAIVAVNTSAVLEAAVLGRRVISMRHPAFQEAFSETFHMRYLLEENGGSVHMTASHEEFLTAVVQERSRATRAEGAIRARAFALSFLRPRGAEAPVARIVVDELEHLADPRVAARPASEATCAL